jgi:hypothetical protein
MDTQKGQAAIIGIVALSTVGLIVAIAIASMSLTEYRLTSDAARGNEVFAATESVLSDVLMRVKKDPSWLPAPYSVTPFSDVSVDVTMTEENDDRIISVTGSKKTVTREIQALFDADTGNVDIFEIEPQP